MPAPGSLPRLQRLLVMVPWVIAHPNTPVGRVCERFGITETELVADLDLLYLCGLPPFTPADLIEAYVEGDRVVIHMADYLARPLRLTRWEATALLVMGRAIAALAAPPEAQALRRALGKLAKAVAPGEAAATEELAGRVAVDLSPSDLLEPLREAIATRRRLRMTYYSLGRDEVTERDLDPWVVFNATGAWYVAGLDHASGEDRIFRIDRIRALTPTGETFERPPGFDPATYARRRLFTPSEQDVDVVLDLAPSAAWVREVTPYEAVDALSDGWIRMRLRTPHTAWLERLLLRLGGGARVVAPEALAGRVRDAARRALARYGET